MFKKAEMISYFQQRPLSTRADKVLNGDLTGVGKIVPFRGHGFAPHVNTLVAFLSMVAIVLIWQAAATFQLVSPTFLPGPLAIFAALEQLAISGQLYTDLFASLFRVGSGWCIGTLIGLTVGVLMGLSTLARSIASPVISLLYPIPKIALLPLFILWLGIGETSKVTIITLGVFYPTAIATCSSIDSVPRNLIRMSQSFGVPMLSIVLKTMIPGALPGILAGMKISIASALVLTVSAEMIGAQHGLGAFVLLAGNLMEGDQLLAGVVMLSLLGLSATLILSRLEKHLLKWR